MSEFCIDDKDYFYRFIFYEACEFFLLLYVFLLI